ncbi:hypothetical protein BGX33_001489 [Mortierella sp. NVP41]|nr:hypothetical protein BGX33_001489 [Mortierella sp. NVP41]
MAENNNNSDIIRFVIEQLSSTARAQETALQVCTRHLDTLTQRVDSLALHANTLTYRTNNLTLHLKGIAQMVGSLTDAVANLVRKTRHLKDQPRLQEPGKELAGREVIVIEDDSDDEKEGEMGSSMKEAVQASLRVSEMLFDQGDNVGIGHEGVGEDEDVDEVSMCEIDDEDDNGDEMFAEDNTTDTSPTYTRIFKDNRLNCLFDQVAGLYQQFPQPIVDDLASHFIYSDLCKSRIVRAALEVMRDDGDDAQDQETATVKDLEQAFKDQIWSAKTDIQGEIWRERSGVKGRLLCTTSASSDCETSTRIKVDSHPRTLARTSVRVNPDPEILAIVCATP